MIIQELLDAKETDSIPELCQRLGKFLGLEEPVPESVLRMALDNELYASSLIIAKDNPDFLNGLFEQSKMEYVADIARPEDSGSKKVTNQHTSSELAKKAVKAFAKWAKAGFFVADEAMLERRVNACLGCEHRAEPTHLLQKVTAVSASSSPILNKLGNSVCNLCGCNLNRKVKLPTETCPAVNLDDPKLSRWGEPIEQK